MNNKSADELDVLLNNQDSYELVEYDNGEVLKEQGVQGTMTARLKPEVKAKLKSLIQAEVRKARVDNKDLVDWVEHKARVWTFANIDPIPNGSYVNVKDLLAQLTKEVADD